MIRPT